MAVAAGWNLVCQGSGCAANAEPAASEAEIAVRLPTNLFITTIVSRNVPSGPVHNGQGPTLAPLKPYSQSDRKKAIVRRVRHFCARRASLAEMPESVSKIARRPADSPRPPLPLGKPQFRRICH